MPQPDQVERFRLGYVGAGQKSLQPAPSGEWVRYPDYEKLEAELEIVKRAWLDADKEKVKEHTAIYAAATDKRQEVEAERDEEIQRTSRWETRCMEADEERDQARKQRDEELRKRLLSDEALDAVAKTIYAEPLNDPDRKIARMALEAALKSIAEETK